MKTHPFLLVNPASGEGSPSPEDLAAAARAAGIEVHVLRRHEDPGELARGAGAAVLGIAGGDGSLAAVAAAALATDAAFVCIPFGTRNHFARDLGLDRDDPFGALAAFRPAGRELRVDVGRVGDRVFLNNVSIGVYERLVRHGWLRALATPRLHAAVDGEPVRARAIVVGNNEYSLPSGERERLDAGVLQLGVAHGFLPHGWELRCAPSLRVELGTPTVRAAIDGDSVVLDTPLVFESQPRALRVRIPPPTEGGAMHDNPEPTEEEQELTQTERGNEEESQRYPSPGQPDAPDTASDDRASE